jgi:hypothetical protein
MTTKTVLYSASGNYDINSSIIPYLQNKDTQRSIFLTLSFTDERFIRSSGKYIMENLFLINEKEINEFNNNGNIYYPEYYFSKYVNTNIYVILVKDITINKMYNIYEYLNKEYHIDKVYLCNIGSNILLSGNEESLGKNIEAIMHMKAIHMCSIKDKYVKCIGLSIDLRNGVLKSDIENKLQFLRDMDIILDEYQLSLTDNNVKAYRDIFYASYPSFSISNSLICARLEYHDSYFLPFHLKKRINRNIIELDNLLTLNITLDLNKLYNNNLFIKSLNYDYHIDEIDEQITIFRHNINKST